MVANVLYKKIISVEKIENFINGASCHANFSYTYLVLPLSMCACGLFFPGSSENETRISAKYFRQKKLKNLHHSSNLLLALQPIIRIEQKIEHTKCLLFLQLKFINIFYRNKFYFYFNESNFFVNPNQRHYVMFSSSYHDPPY